MNTIYTTTIPFASGTWGVRYGLFGVPFALLLAGLGMKRMPAPLLILAPFSVAGFYFNATATMYGNMVFKKSLNVTPQLLERGITCYGLERLAEHGHGLHPLAKTGIAVFWVLGTLVFFNPFRRAGSSFEAMKRSKG